jgi:hypothetical protein
MAKTTVDWLIDQLMEKGDAWTNVSISKIQISINDDEFTKILEQAKEMDKQQKIDAWEDGHDSFSSFSTRNAEQYHKETFGGTDII